MKSTIYKGSGDKDDKDDICGTLTLDGVSTVIVHNMKTLGLTATEVILLEYLLSYSSEGESHVAPSLKEMHRATGFAPGTIHAAKRGLISKGFVTILNERNEMRTNNYDLSLLWEKLEGLTGQQSDGNPNTKAATGEDAQD
jgi:hypothetical protein